MRPGGFSQSGFLGVAERLDDVVACDALTVAKLGLTHERIAAELESIIDTAVRGQGRKVRVGRHFEARIDQFTGFQICPWAPDPHHAQCQAGGGVRHASLNWEIRNRLTGQAMRGPGLIIHLIRAHRFFEGIESPSRVDPGDLVRLLNLQPTNG